MWLLYSLLAAFFAAITSILAKIGIQGVDSNLATAIRTLAVLAMAWLIVFLTDAQSGLTEISRRSMLFLLLSGIATGASWLCYYKAIQIGIVGKVVAIDKLSLILTLIFAAIFLGEAFSLKIALGGILIAIGTLMIVL